MKTKTILDETSSAGCNNNKLVPHEHFHSDEKWREEKNFEKKCILFVHFLNDYDAPRDGNVAEKKAEQNKRKKMWKITAISEADDAQ